MKRGSTLSYAVPPVPNNLFRETIRYPACGERKYIRYLDGQGRFAHVSLQLVPHPGELCCVTVDAACGLPAQAIAGAERAITERFDHGRQSRLPFIGVEVRIVGGTWLPRYSHPEACAIAASMAFDEAMRCAAPMIVEPYTRVSLLVEFEALARTIRALSALLGEVHTFYRVTDIARLDAEIPVRLLEEVHSMGLRVFSMSSLPKETQYRQVPLSGSSVADALDDWT